MAWLTPFNGFCVTSYSYLLIRTYGTSSLVAMQFGSQPPLNMVFYRNYQTLPDVWNRPMGTSGGGDAELKEVRHRACYMYVVSVCHIW